MIQECKFCKESDLQIHVPNLFIDMEKAIESGVVPPITSVEEYNHLDADTVQKSYRLREVFDGVENGMLQHSFTTDFLSGTGTTVVSTSSQSTPPDEGSGN